MTNNVFRSNYDGKRFRVQLSFCDEDGVPLVNPTKQANKDECDINNILRKYDSTGLITHVNEARAMYGDFTEVNEYKEACNLVISARDSFADLPSDIRKRFANDPGSFFEFVSNPDNLEEMYEMGIAIRRPVDASVSTDSDGATPSGGDVETSPKSSGES